MAQSIPCKRCLTISTTRLSYASLFHCRQPHQLPQSVRSFGTSIFRFNNSPAVSFGAETDLLLAQLEDVSIQSKKSKLGKGQIKSAQKVDLETKQKKIEKNSDGSSEIVSKAIRRRWSSNTSHELKRKPHDANDKPVALDSSSIPTTSPKISKKNLSRPSKPAQDAEKSQQISAMSDQKKKPQAIPSTKENISSTKPTWKAEPWQTQKKALKEKFGEEGWNPRKKLSPDAMDGIRSLHEQDPEKFTTATLSQQFKVSPEAIRRILKSKWQRANEDVMDDRRVRWAKRHDRIWDHKAELGLRPPRTKDRVPEGPEKFEEEMQAREILGRDL